LVLLGTFSADPDYDPAERLIGTDDFVVHIAPQCSGYVGIGLVTDFFSAYLRILRRDLCFPAALVLQPVAADQEPASRPG
jgi:hypothetical protein